MNKKIIVTSCLVVVLLLCFFSYKYVMTGGGRDLKTEKSEFDVTAVAIFAEFSADSEMASKKYLNKAIEISGKVSSVKGDVITLDNKVSCQLLVIEKVETDSRLKIKGRVTGYDDLLEELKLDQCSIVK
ncbi:OB-fold protein [Flavobacterium nackdongense]|uniref:tRNA_anti-like n=1 Tax=Flavobacterium nackdongense TaxID=2547394 RepID=A0A4V1AGK1_9FLAO|nr:hypothetical protein [Flavobacterium nackdongense]QBN18322.1 hypothetical protein E1750_05700 [Flavobacterium nackdongense]